MTSDDPFARGERRLKIVIVATVMVVVTFLVVLFVLALTGGNHQRSAVRDCHARGPAYHYWSDRNRCVKYV